MVTKGNNYSKAMIIKSAFILFSLIVIIGFVGATTLNVIPDFLNERNVTVAAADRLVALQATDG